MANFVGDLVILHTQSTKGHPPQADLVDFAAICIDKNGLFEKEFFSTLIHSAKLSGKYEANNGISPEMMASAPAFANVYQHIYNILHNRIWVGHDITGTSYALLENEFKKIGKECPEPSGTLDTFPLLKRTFAGRTQDLTLETLAQTFGLGVERRRSLQDARLTLEVLKMSSLALFLETHARLPTGGPAAMRGRSGSMGNLNVPEVEGATEGTGKPKRSPGKQGESLIGKPIKPKAKSPRPGHGAGRMHGAMVTVDSQVDCLNIVVEAMERNKELRITYEDGPPPHKVRRVVPIKWVKEAVMFVGLDNDVKAERHIAFRKIIQVEHEEWGDEDGHGSISLTGLRVQDTTKPVPSDVARTPSGPVMLRRGSSAGYQGQKKDNLGAIAGKGAGPTQDGPEESYYDSRDVSEPSSSPALTAASGQDFVKKNMRRKSIESLKGRLA